MADTDGDSTANSREQGVEFGSLADDLEAQNYPMTRAELLSAFGDRELDVADGTRRLDAVLGDQPEEAERTYDSAEAVKQAVLTMIGESAVGRADYTDRGGDLPDESAEGESTDEQSL